MKLCKFYIEGNCKHGTECKFIHKDNICRNYFLHNKCKHGTECKFIHENNNIIKNKNQPKLKRINTEIFIPSYEPGDMNIILTKPNIKLSDNDVFLTTNLFKENTEYEIYNKLLNEIKDDKVWKLWHGDTHLIADDHRKWKNECPTFNYIIETLKNYFNVDIKATRLNWYRNNTEWKPYHFDAAAIDKEKAKLQNITIGVSFGTTRTIGFEHDKTKTKIFFPLENCVTYGFTKNININWRHGIPPTNVFSDIGRISIIIWGYVELL